MIGAADGKLMNAKRLRGSSIAEQIPCIALKKGLLCLDFKAIHLPLLGVRLASPTDGRVHRPRAAAGPQITARGTF
jgi:hypothetical protein